MSHRLTELAALFGRLGFTSFGGPAAHIAMIEDEVVRRRGWIDRERFLDLLGATNLIPGPNSTELAIHIGFERAGWAGLLVAGACFILPAALIVGVIAWAYVRYGSLPAFGDIMYGVQPVVIAIVAQALWGLGRTAVKSWLLGVIGALAFAAALLGIDELAVLAAAGLAVVIARRLRTPALAVIPIAGPATAATFGLWPLFLTFVKIGSVLFGSGYVLIAFLRADLVEHFHWLTESQLLDAVAVGQVTPGPVFTTATFIGYVLAGVSGAGVATLGIFLPAFIFVAASGPLVPRIRRSAVASAVLDGVNVASLALMGVVAIQLGRVAIVDIPTAALALVSTVVLVRYRPSSTWVVLAGVIVGLVRMCC